MLPFSGTYEAVASIQHSRKFLGVRRESIVGPQEQMMGSVATPDDDVFRRFVIGTYISRKLGAVEYEEEESSLVRRLFLLG